MTHEIVTLTPEQCADIEDRLARYDEKYITYKLDRSVSLGIMQDGKLIAGADGCMTAFKIFYVSTVFVDENHRGCGIGRRLMQSVEEKAKALGANMIRLDTFNWQGADFYQKLGYRQVGQYTSEADGFSEHFFVKRI